MHSVERKNRLVRQAEAGYTLTELLVVMVVLGLIAAAITPQVLGRLDKSKVRAAVLQLDTLGASLDLYKIDVGHYPTKDQGLGSLIRKPGQSATWDGPYVRSARNLIDPWGQEFVYEPSGAGRRYQITSLGSDGEMGGSDDASDLTFPDLDLASQN